MRSCKIYLQCGVPEERRLAGLEQELKTGCTLAAASLFFSTLNPEGSCLPAEAEQKRVQDCRSLRFSFSKQGISQQVWQS